MNPIALFMHGLQQRQCATNVRPPYVLDAIVCISLATVSDRIRKRGVILMCLGPCIIIGFALLATVESVAVRYFAVSLSTAGGFCASPLLLSWGVENVSGPSVKAIYSVGIGSLGALISTWTYLPKEGPKYQQGHYMNLGFGALLYVTTTSLTLYLRLENRQKDSDSVYEFLWVDAICINQGTSPAACKERSIQITLMKRIYEQAKTVLVWLGNPENETNNRLAFQKMNDIYARFRQTQKKNRTYRPWWWPHAPERTEDDVFKTMASISADDRSLFDVEGSETHKAWLGILSLWRNPWWTRTWVYQEATIPEDHTMFYIAGVTVRPIKCKVKFLCGNEMGSWSTLARAMTVADHLQAMPSIDTGFMRGAQEPFRRLLAFRQKRIQSIPQSLLDLLQSFRRTECQDPRDKVYSPLCLAPPESQAFMAPDYLGKNTLDVYLEVAKFSLTQPDRQLDFLGFAVWLPEVPRPPPPDLPSASFPTWLPNWFQPVDIIPIPKTMFVLNPPRSKALRPYDRRSIPKNDEDEVQSYKATPSTPCPVRILSLRLHVRAIYVDTIADIMPLNNSPSGIATTKERGFEWDKASAGRYPINGETLVSAMKRTEVLDMNYDWQGRACSRGATLDWAFLNKPRDQLTNEEYEEQWTMQIAFNSGTRGRSLGLTGRGFLGMIPQGAVVGDRVFAFLGGRVLYTVRCLGEGDREGVFMYIGETYLHGWMDGEVMELVVKGEAKVEDVVLV